MLSRFGHQICSIDSASHPPSSPEQMGRISLGTALFSLHLLQSNNVHTFLSSHEKSQSHARMHACVCRESEREEKTTNQKCQYHSQISTQL
jgi:hypothetical protein